MPLARALRIDSGMKTKTTTIIAATLVALGTLTADAATMNLGVKTRPETKPHWFKNWCQRLTWEEIVKVVQSPNDICYRVRGYVKYRRDRMDEWATGEETVKRGYGDCEDFAAAVRDLCAAKGFDANIYVFSGNGTGAHAATVGTWKGRMWMSSNGSWEAVDSLDDAGSMIARHMGWKSDETTWVLMPGDMAKHQFKFDVEPASAN